MEKSHQRRKSKRYWRSPVESERLCEIFKLLGDPVKLEIIGILSLRSSSVCELVYLIGKSQPCISHHLKMLRAYGLIEGEKRGRFTIFSFIREGNNGLNEELVNIIRKYTPLEEVIKKVKEVEEIGREEICRKVKG
ncbi:ArsR family transcriptional regulator [bacterium]|nr:MAG: ArsR family transcriptional regulator [bacterium]